MQTVGRKRKVTATRQPLGLPVRACANARCCCCMTPNPQTSCCTLPRCELLPLCQLSFSAFQFSNLPLSVSTSLHCTTLHHTTLHFTTPHFFCTGRGRKPGSECMSRRRWFRRGCVKRVRFVKEFEQLV